MLKITIDMTKDPDWNQLEGLLGTAKAEWILEMKELERELDHLDKVLAAKAAKEAAKDDAPPWTKEQLKSADLYRGNRLVRRGSKKNKR